MVGFEPMTNALAYTHHKVTVVVNSVNKILELLSNTFI